MPENPRPSGTPRRTFLRLLAAAPAAAGCASAARSAGSSADAPRKEAAPAPGSEAASAQEALAAMRGVPLALDVEPAFVFRALAARSRE